MGRTNTIRVDDETYEKIRTAADSEMRSISNFMEFATVNYLETSGFVTEEEMRGISENPKLLHSLKQSLDDILEGRHRIVN